MKRFAKIISALLAVLMVMGTLTVAVSASIPLLPYESEDKKEYEKEDLVNNKEDLTYEVDWEDTINVYLGETSKINNKDNEDKQIVYATPQEKLASMNMMWENHGYQLWVDDVTGEVATVKVSTGEILFSNPWDAQKASYENGSNKKTTSLAVKKQLLSQIVVNYVDNGSNKTMYSCTDAAARGQISVDYISNGVRVEYSIGREETRMLLPRLIKKESFETKILKPMRELFNKEAKVTVSDGKVRDENGQLVAKNTDVWPLGVVGETYNHYDLVLMHDPNFDMSGEWVAKYDHFEVRKVAAYYDEKNLDKAVSDREAASILAAFPITKKMAVYVFDPVASPLEQVQVERRIKDYVPSYTYEELDRDHAETEYTGVEKAPALFKMALEYTLDENGMSVRLPANGIRFDQSLYQLNNIEMLPYMGAGANDGDFEDGGDGYNFFPDGSGALLDFEQLNVSQDKQVGGKVYGHDYAYHELTGTYQETIRYPVFGIVEKSDTPTMVVDYDNVITEAVYDNAGNLLTPAEYGTKIETVKQDKGFVAIIEEGDALAELISYHMGAKSIYNTVKMCFYPRPKDSYNMADALSVGSNTKMTVVSDRKYVGNYKVRYIMLSDDKIAAENNLTSYYEASWMGMAVAYRDYLEANSVLDRLTASDVDDDIPLYIETFGALWSTDKILSIPVDVMTPLTSFEDVKTMYSELSSAIESSMAGIIASGENNATTESTAKDFSNINFKLTGYANGGMSSTVPYNLNWESAVGGASGFQELVDYSKKEGFDLFPDFDFVYINMTEALDGVNLQTDAVKTIDNRYTGRRTYSATTQSYQGYFGLAIAPSCFEKFITKLAVNYLKYNPTGISVSTLGTDLNSDFDEDDPLNREDSKSYTIEAFKQLNQLRTEGGESLQIMTDGGNSYTWRYVDHIVNMPLNSSRYNISSNAVPFIGVVLHGYVQFAGTPINEEGDIELAFLKAIENGANLYFTLSYQNTQKLKEYTNLSKYFSVRYDIWKEDVVDMYVELNDLLCDLQTKLIIDHDFLVGDRVPDDNEYLEDLENIQLAEDLKQAAETIEQIKQSLKDILALRHTPTESVETVEAALKEAGIQAKILARNVAMLKGDSDYISECVELIRTVKKAEDSVAAAKKATFNGEAGNAAVDAVKAYVKDAIIVKAIASSEKLIAGLNDADKAKAAELQDKLVNIAISVSSDKAVKLAVELLDKTFSSTNEEKLAIEADVNKLISDVEAAMQAIDSKGLDNVAEAIINDTKSALASGIASEALSTAKKTYNSSIESLEKKFETAVDKGVAVQTLVNEAYETAEKNKVDKAVELYETLKGIEYKLSSANSIKNGFSGKVSSAYDTPINDLYTKLNALISSDDFKDASGKEISKAVKDALTKVVSELEKNKQLLALYTALDDAAFAAKVETYTKKVAESTEKYNALSNDVKTAADKIWNELMAEISSVQSDASKQYEYLVNEINEVFDANEAIYLQYSRDDIKSSVSIINDAGRYSQIQNVARLYAAADNSFASDIAYAKAIADSAAATAESNKINSAIKVRVNRVIERCSDLIKPGQAVVDANLGKLYMDVAAAELNVEALGTAFASEITKYKSAVASIAELEEQKAAAHAELEANEQIALDKAAAEEVFNAKKTEFEAKAGTGKAAQITKIIDSIAKAQTTYDTAKLAYDYAKALYNPTGDTTNKWRADCTDAELRDYDRKEDAYTNADNALKAEKAALEEAKSEYADCLDELNALIEAYEAQTIAQSNAKTVQSLGSAISAYLSAAGELSSDAAALLKNAVAAAMKRNELNSAISGSDSYKTLIDAAANAFEEISNRYETAKDALTAAEKATEDLLARVTSTVADKAEAEWIAGIYEIAAVTAANSPADLRLLAKNAEEGSAEKVLYERACIIISTELEALKEAADASLEEKSEAKLIYAAAQAYAKHSTKGLAELNESYQRQLLTAEREMSNAKQFYDTAVADTAEAKAAFEEIEALYNESKASYESLIVLQANVLLFGDDSIDALKKTATADIIKTNDLYDAVLESVSTASAEWAKLEEAAAAYKSAKEAYDALLVADMSSMTAEQKSANRVDRVYYAYQIKIAEEQINACKDAIEAEFADNFSMNYSNLVRLIDTVKNHEAEAKIQFELAETLYKSVRTNSAVSNDIKKDAKSAYDSAKALYEFIKANNEKFTAGADGAKSEFEILRDEALKNEMIVVKDETAENKEYVAAETFTKVQDYVDELFGIAVEENEEKEASKYLCDDGSIVAVTYGGKDGNDAEAYRTFLLNFNSFKVTVNYEGVDYIIDAYGYQVVNHYKEGEAA